MKTSLDQTHKEIQSEQKVSPNNYMLMNINLHETVLNVKFSLKFNIKTYPLQILYGFSSQPINSSYDVQLNKFLYFFFRR